MYLDYFSLERHPFRITPDTSLFFSGGDQGRGVVLDAMLFAIENGEGILKVVGEVGSGKTMLCRMLEERLPKSTEVVYLANPKLDPDDILYAVAFELKLPVRRETSRLLVMQQLQNYLLKQHAANCKVLITIEEAQSMPFETLEEIRLLSNLETKRDKLMQIILFGQPELDKCLSAKNIRQLRERITHSFYLSPLSPKEVADYIRFRLGAAGCPCPQLLTRGAERLIAKASGGLTRRINILTDKALLAAYSNNVLKSGKKLNPGVRPMIRRKHVAAAIRDSDYPFGVLHILLSPLRLVSASMLAVSIAVTFLLWPQVSTIASQSKIGQQLLQAININYAAGSSISVMPKPLPIPVTEADVSLFDADTTTGEIDADAAGKLSATIEVDDLSLIETGLTDTGLTNTGVTEIAIAETAVTEIPKTNEVIESGAAQQNIENVTNNSKTLTRSRLLASIDWLQQVDRDGYTVQFIYDEVKNLDFAETFLEILNREQLLADSYVCISSDGSENYWTVKYGNFSGLTSAQQFVNELPEVMHEFKPFVQNMSVVECNTNTTIAALILE